MNLNLNEQLLRDTKDAHICIFIANLASWLRYNAAKEKPADRNYHEGRYWSYNSIKDFQKYFDFWSVKNIRTIIKHCEAAGLILISNFNKHRYDQTLWYSLTDKALEYYPTLKEIFCTVLPDAANGNVGNGKPIPENTTTCSNNTITTNSSSSTSKAKEKNLNIMREMIDVYRETFPNNPQPHPTLIATSLQKTLQTLIKRWPEADPNGKALDIPAFRRYLIAMRDYAPGFSLNEYTTKDGNKKKNNMETFCRWNTLVKFLENQYS
jgi:hypothetical protein